MPVMTNGSLTAGNLMFFYEILTTKTPVMMFGSLTAENLMFFYEILTTKTPVMMFRGRIYRTSET